MTRQEPIGSKYFAAACLGIIGIFFFSIMGRFAVEQIVVKKLGTINSFTTAIFFDVPELNRLPGKTQKNVPVDWQKQYPFTGANGQAEIFWLKKYQAKAVSVEKKIQDWTGKFLLGRTTLTSLAEDYRKMLCWTLDGAGKTDEDAFFLQNGFLTFYQHRVKEKELVRIADSVAEFQGWLAERKIPFLYVNMGSKVNPQDKQMTVVQQWEEFTNENGDALLAELAKRQIDSLDMRQEMHRAGLDWYASYYKYDHHWKTQTGMWAAGILAERLNRDYGFHYDRKYFEPQNYLADSYPWKGNQWRALYKTSGRNCDSEDYTYFLPRFATQFSISVPTRGIDRQGEYKDTLIDRQAVADSRSYTEEEMASKLDAYFNATWHNDALGIIKNQQTVHNPKKILMLQDSFSFYLSTYLACDTAELDLIYSRTYDGSIRAYIEKMQPDMVIVLYCEQNIEEIDGSSHKAFFDFR